MSNPLILEIKGNSLDDGPGIRSVVFFKGCPLSCTWCHNPESKQTSNEISFDPKECVGCNTCMETCKKHALSKENPFFINREVCDLCFECTDTCPSGALAKVGKKRTIHQITEAIIRDKPFFDTSGGGVTFSGGEPTLYMEFLSDLCKELTQNEVHILIETCGQFNLDQFDNLVYPHVDTIYFDIKLYDSENHKRFCGLPNQTIIDNFRTLHSRFLNGGKDILPRIPLIPNITDTEENLREIVSFFRKENVTKTQMMAYHPLWQEKNRKIGIDPSSNHTEEMNRWMEGEKVDVCKKYFTDAGIDVE